MASDEEDEPSAGPSTSTPKREVKHKGKGKKSKTEKAGETEGEATKFEDAFMVIMKDSMEKGKKVRPFYMYEHNSSFLTVTA